MRKELHVIPAKAVAFRKGAAGLHEIPAYAGARRGTAS